MCLRLFFYLCYCQPAVCLLCKIIFYSFHCPRCIIYKIFPEIARKSIKLNMCLCSGKVTLSSAFSIVTFFSFEKLCISNSFIPFPSDEVMFSSSSIFCLHSYYLFLLLLVLYMLMYKLILCQAAFRKSIALLKRWFLCKT